MDVIKLKVKMLETGINASILASELGQTRQNIYKKISGKADFSLKDIKFLRKKLSLTDEELIDIFINN